MARILIVVALALSLLGPAVASAATPAELIGAYAAQRDDAIADARDAITAAGPGSPDARRAAADARARLASLADALRATAGGAAGPAVEARLDADAAIAQALADHAAGRIDADALDDHITSAEAAHARDARAGTGADDGSLGGLDILQAIGGPAILVGVVAFMAMRSRRRRKAEAIPVVRRRTRVGRS
ncbi:MAG: hypothetical protein AB7V62_16825 [Thermoleophilia bacterium]